MRKVPVLRFNEFSDNWINSNIEKVMSIYSGKDYKHLYEGIIPVYGTGGLMTYVNDYLSLDDAIGIGRKGTINKPYYLKAPFWTVDTLFYCIPKDDYNINFVLFSLQKINLLMYNEASGVPSLSKETIKKIPFITPCKNEQAKIASFLQLIDKKIKLQQSLIENIKEYKKSCLQGMFPKNNNKTPSIRFPEFTDTWEQRKLIDVSKYRNGKAHENEIDIYGKYIVVNSKFISTEGNVKKFTNKLLEPLRKNEIVFVLSDVPNGKAIARTYLIPENNKYSLNQRIAGITPNDDTSSYFLHILMNRNTYFLKFDDGSKQTNLTRNNVTDWIEYYPCFKEQTRIADFFQTLDNTITIHQSKLEKIQELKKGLLQQMFV